MYTPGKFYIPGIRSAFSAIPKNTMISPILSTRQARSLLNAKAAICLPEPTWEMTQGMTIPFGLPWPDLSVKYGTPNACNNCHKDKSALWTANAVKKWYGPGRAYHFAEDLIPASKENAGSEGHIMKLLSDTATPAIIKATALYYLKDINTANSSQTLLKSLKDKNPQVRYQALRSLSNFPPGVWLGPQETPYRIK